MTKQILVIGKNGQLGRSLEKILRRSSEFHNINSIFKSKKIDYEKKSFVFVSRDELDLSNKFSILSYFKKKNFSAIINCAAYTNVDNAETDKKLADTINNLALLELAEIAKNFKVPLIHISTDYVFNGKAIKPYVETDKTDPLNIYGLTKLKGEKILMDSGCIGSIIRTSWVYSEFGNNFLKTMIKLAKEKTSINVVFDQVSCPTYATNLAEVVLVILKKLLMSKIQNSKLNIYHFSDEGFCSRYDFVKFIFEINNISCKVNAIETTEYPSLARRPYYSVMNKSKIKHLLPDLVIPHWKDSVISCLSEIKRQEDSL